MKHLYKTNDLALAAFLLSKGIELKQIDRSQPQKIQFSFTQTKQLDAHCDHFWSHTAKVCPLAYFLKIKLLKKLIFQNPN